MTGLVNIHPGEVLLEEFLKPMELSQNRLPREISVPPRRIKEIVLGKRAISADTTVRLARYFGTSKKLWIGLQADYDLEEVHRNDAALEHQSGMVLRTSIKLALIPCVMSRFDPISIWMLL